MGYKIKTDKIKLDYLKSLSPIALHCSNSTIIRKYVYTIMRAKDGHVALEMDKSEISRHSFVDGISVHWEIAHPKVYTL